MSYLHEIHKCNTPTTNDIDCKLKNHFHCFKCENCLQTFHAYIED
jgi:hypothetical protein